MNDNEIVLNLLAFYKRKGIDLYKVLDDPTFKSLSLDTKLKSLQMYAGHILAGTPSGFSKDDFKSILKNTLIQTGVGALSGGATAFGLSKAFHGGTVPTEALGAGAMFGGIAGAFNGLLTASGKVKDRRFMRSELETLQSNPTPGNALNVLTANHVRVPMGEESKKILDKIREKTDSTVNSGRDDAVKKFTEDANAGKKRF